MKLLGFNFTKLHAEKLSEKKEGIKLNRKFDISDIKEVNANMLNTQGKVLAVTIYDKFNYEPSFAKIELEGRLLVSINEKTGDSVLEEWKNNSTPKEFKAKVLNIFFKKSDVKALNFEEELNIPFHLRLSRVKAPSEEQKQSQE